VLETQDALLRAIVARVRGRASDEIASDVRVHQFLAELERTTETSSAMSIVDPATGRLLASSIAFPPPAGGDVSNQPWLAAHRDDKTLLHVGPLTRLPQAGPTGMTVSRRDPASRLVAICVVGTDALSQPFTIVREGAHDTLTLALSDGATLARERPGTDPFGFRLPQDTVFMRWRRGEVTLPAIDRAGIDGNLRLWPLDGDDALP